METIIIKKSSKKDKKLVAKVGNKHIHFGASGYSDYTLHKDDERKQRYINRHKRMGEDWSKSGIDTAGFYAKNILWNKKTIQDSIKDLNSKYKNIKFKYEK